MNTVLPIFIAYINVYVPVLFCNLVLQRKPLAFELFFCLANAVTSHLAQKHVA